MSRSLLLLIVILVILVGGLILLSSRDTEKPVTTVEKVIPLDNLTN
ncbi:hypothetical protein KY084_01835 [Stakelama sp. CBK3Z-3]|uniref:DsbE family thiol:disulfide interchange protein n=1 Tax=Stakelama flava TaxID=2860338 RepID=A0ABS6XHC6_9SPHN|nr:hypothetical protein [Stakelama flava]MBW4329615.1 hypothetical protein [Stakelama flava]